MSKSSKTVTVKTSAELITAEQFIASLDAIKAQGTEAKTSIKTAVVYVMQQTNYKDQQAALKKLATAYKALKSAIGDATITDRVAIQWIRRQVKAIAPKYEWLKSASAAAQKKAKQRAARQSKAAEKEKAAPAAKPKAEPETAISKFRNALIEKEINLQNEFRGVIPAGKVQQFDQAFAAFIESIKTILA
jgi:hypothetical protein